MYWFVLVQETWNKEKLYRRIQESTSWLDPGSAWKKGTGKNEHFLLEN